MFRTEWVLNCACCSGDLDCWKACGKKEHVCGSSALLAAVRQLKCRGCVFLQVAQPPQPTKRKKTHGPQSSQGYQAAAPKLEILNPVLNTKS